MLPISVDKTTWSHSFEFNLSQAPEEDRAALHLLVVGRPDSEHARIRINDVEMGATLFNSADGNSADRRPGKPGTWLTRVINTAQLQEGSNTIQFRKIDGSKPDFSVEGVELAFFNRADHPYTYATYERYPFPAVPVDLSGTSEPSADPPAEPLVDNFQLLIDSVSLPHEPRGEVLDLPESYCQGNGGYPGLIPPPGTNCNRKLDGTHNVKNNSFNPWNHICIDWAQGVPSPGLRVNMSDMILAILVDGQWRERNFGPPKAGRIYPDRNPKILMHSGRDVIKVFDDYSQIAAGWNGWTETRPTREPSSHLWSGGFMEGFNGSQIEAVICWAQYWLTGTGDEGYYYARQGADQAEADATSRKGLGALCCGANKMIRFEPEYFFATDRTPETLRALRDAGNLPPSFPL